MASENSHRLELMLQVGDVMEFHHITKHQAAQNIFADAVVVLSLQFSCQSQQTTHLISVLQSP